jgi:hypothetical protein
VGTHRDSKFGKSKVDSQRQKKLLIALIYQLHFAIVGPH